MCIRDRQGSDPEDGLRLRYRCRVDQGAWSKPTTANQMAVGSLIRSAGLKRGIHVFAVKAVDKAGLESQPISTQFRVK